MKQVLFPITTITAIPRVLTYWFQRVGRMQIPEIISPSAITPHKRQNCSFNLRLASDNIVFITKKQPRKIQEVQDAVKKESK